MSYQSLPTVGQKLMAASLPVVLASDQSAVPVSGTVAITAASLPLPSGAATSALQSAGNVSLVNIDADLGAQADAAASSDTGTFSLIALVKRLLTKLPAALGQTNMAGALSVVLASNQSAVNVSPDNVLDSLTTSGNVTSATNVVSVATNGFMGGSFHVTSAGTTCTITYEQSNDGTNWVTLPVVSGNVSTNTPVNTSTSIGIFNFVSAAAFVRARVSTYTSGTVSVTLTQKRYVAPVGGVSIGGGAAGIGFVSIAASQTLATVTTVGNITRQSGFTDSSTVLAASATFTGAGRATTGANYTRFVATAFADQAGTLIIDLSTDTGTTYRQIASVAVAANVAQQLSVLLTGAAGAATLYRVRYVNGGTLQTAFQLSSAFLA